MRINEFWWQLCGVSFIYQWDDVGVGGIEHGFLIVMWVRVSEGGGRVRNHASEWYQTPSIWFSGIQSWGRLLIWNKRRDAQNPSWLMPNLRFSQSMMVWEVMSSACVGVVFQSCQRSTPRHPWDFSTSGSLSSSSMEILNLFPNRTSYLLTPPKVPVLRIRVSLCLIASKTHLTLTPWRIYVKNLLWREKCEIPGPTAQKTRSLFQKACLIKSELKSELRVA